MNHQNQIYIDSVRDQINSGMYDRLFKDKSDLVFLDIGANIGLVSVYAVPYCQRIVSIEPSPDVFPVLEHNTKNYIAIESHCLALAPKDGVCQFFVNDINFTASSTVNTYGKLITVDGLTLKSILAKFNLRHVDVCKVDCEGAEGEALDYYAISQASEIIDQWFIEFHNCPQTSWEHKLGTAVGNFLRCGYTKMVIDGMALTATKL